jgi:hypothetical protein
MRADDQDSPLYSGKNLHSRLVFLGPEFLTWLYFHIEQSGGEIPFGKASLKISVGKKITLRPLAADDIRISVTGPALDDSGEVLQAVRAGAHVDTMAIDIVMGERIHSFTVSAADGGLSNAKTRQLFELTDGDVKATGDFADESSILFRMSNLDEIEDVLNALFNVFLGRRLAQAFVSQDIATMRQSVSDGLKAKLPRAATLVE